MKKEGFPRFINKEELKRYIDQGFDVNASSNHLNTLVPLAWAVQKRLFDCVKMLLEANADPNVHVDNLHIACIAFAEAAEDMNDTKKVLKLLIDYGLNINAQNNRGDTCMHFACYHDNSFNIVKLLLEVQANPNITDVFGTNVLGEIIDERVPNDQLITLLLNNGAEIPSGRHVFSKEVSSTIRKLCCIKRVLITFFALSKKTGAIHKDLRNPIAKMVWETREDDAWDREEYFEKKNKK